MKFEELSEEGQEAAKWMIYCMIQGGMGMGMDEGRDLETEEFHPWVQELIDFTGHEK